MSIRVDIDYKTRISNINRVAIILMHILCVFMYKQDRPTFYLRHIETEQSYIQVMAI